VFAPTRWATVGVHRLLFGFDGGFASRPVRSCRHRGRAHLSL